jgi:hypothetical protein
LLVATRRSGWQVLPPANVQVAKLASYAQPEARLAEEYREVVARWNQARQELECLPEIGTLARLGVLDAFPKYFRQGLAIRNAWRNVFEREPIQSVLCGDDSNPYTTIPLQLARNRGLPAVAVHHGALDGRQLFKPKLFDVVLAKGRMEEDYLSQVCGIEPSRIEIGAPLDAPGAQPRNAQTQGRSPQAIVFFSEKCEVAGARAEDFYADLLPRLADLAAKHGRKLIIKLHPFESRREREQLVAKTLTPEQRSVTKVVSGTLTPGLLEQTWFGITILSTATTECVMAGVPCFLCAWLDYSHWGYISQFEKFGAGRALKSPEEIDQIPRILASYPWSKSAKKNFWETIDRTRLRELLSSSSATENEHLHARPGDASCELEAIPH